MSDKITLPKGSRHYDSFNNYVDRKRGGVSRKSMLDHVSKGRYHINVHSKGALCSWGAKMSKKIARASSMDFHA